MSNTVLKSKANDIETNSGNQLTLFVDLQGVMTVIDYRGVYQPLSDYIVSSPSFSQVEYFDTRADFPATGSVDVIYVATDTDIPYDWNPVTNDYDVLSANVGIGGLGNPPFFPIFTAPNQLGNSCMAQGNAAIVINPGQQLLDGNTLFSIQRIAGQAQLDFVIGNPGFDQPCQIISDNSIDGFEFIGYGSVSLIGGTSNLGLKVDSSGNVTCPLRLESPVIYAASGINGCSLSSNLLSNVEAGVYSSNGDEIIADYNRATNVYRYANSNLEIDLINKLFTINSLLSTDSFTINGSSVVIQGVDNATTIALTSSDLNTVYPGAPIGFKVYCLLIIAGAMIYEKTPTGWVEYICTIA